jgi:hypothetical protein
MLFLSSFTGAKPLPSSSASMEMRCNEAKDNVDNDEDDRKMFQKQF